MVFLIPLRFVFYTAPKTMLTEGTHLTLSQKLKAFLTPPMGAVFVGLVFYLCQWQLPQVLADVAAGFHAAATPVGMLTCGLVLGKRPFKRLLRKKYLLVSLLRLLAIPALFYLLLLPLPVSQEIRQVVVLCAALPAASLTASFTLPAWTPSSTRRGAYSFPISCALPPSLCGRWCCGEKKGRKGHRSGIPAPVSLWFRKIG